MSTTEHTSEHHDEEHSHIIFREFHMWNQLSSTVILIIVMVLGSVANIFICYCIYKKRIGTKYVNPVLLALSLKNIIAISTCVPLAIVMLNCPSTIIRSSCDVQENITFVILFAGYFFPMLLSMVQCDHVFRPQRHLLGGKRIILIVLFVWVVSIIMGMQSEISRDEHGCHLWSIRTDAVVLTYIFSIASVVLLTLVVMVTCYMMIYSQARASQEAVEASTQIVENKTEVASTSAIQRIPNDKLVPKRTIPLRRKMTTAILKPMFFIVMINVLTSFPWIIFYVFTVYDHIENSSLYAEIRILTMSIMYLPIATDPIIFLTFSTKGRKAVRAILKRNHPTVTPFPTVANVSRQYATSFQDAL